MSSESVFLDAKQYALYAGTAGVSHAWLELGLRVGPPVDMKAGWKLDEADLFELLLRMSATARIGLLWLGPPCSMYSLARAPRLRSVQEPWGFDILEPETASGNLHMHQSLSLFLGWECLCLEVAKVSAAVAKVRGAAVR